MRRFTDFKCEVGGEEREFRVYEPTVEMQNGATKIKNGAFREMLESGAMLRLELNDILKERGIWSNEKEAEYTSLQRELFAADKRLQEGGFALTEARKLALEMRRLRNEMRELLSERSQLDNNTVEGQVENKGFNYLVSQCLVYNKGDEACKFFSSYEEFLDSDEQLVAILAASKLASLLYNVGDDFEKELAENKFLLEYGFVDEKLRFINKEGDLVDSEDRLVDEEGFFVDKDGNKVDVDGVPLTEDGGFKVEFKGFTDEKGKPVKEKEQDGVKQPKKKAGSSKKKSESA